MNVEFLSVFLEEFKNPNIAIKFCNDKEDLPYIEEINDVLVFLNYHWHNDCRRFTFEQFSLTREIQSGVGEPIRYLFGDRLISYRNPRERIVINIKGFTELVKEQYKIKYGI